MTTGRMKAVAATALTLVTLLAASGASALEPRLNGQAFYDAGANLTWLQDANYAQTSGYDADGSLTWADANSWAGSLNIGGVTGWRVPRARQLIGTSYAASPNTGSSSWLTSTTEHGRIDGGELGDLFSLFGLADLPLPMLGYQGNANYSLFSNILDNAYLTHPIQFYSEGTRTQWTYSSWLGDPHNTVISSSTVTWTPSEAEYFFFLFRWPYGYHSEGVDAGRVWLVHDGDVGASPIPLPTAVFLLPEAHYGSVSPIPLPAAVFLLAPALVGLGCMRRRATIQI